MKISVVVKRGWKVIQIAINHLVDELLDFSIFLFSERRVLL